ncbi:MAG TPA: c-type cytochrome [Azonexus sp.]|nr:c-type cytochrome [Azonexus sp.]
MQITKRDFSLCGLPRWRDLLLLCMLGGGLIAGPALAQGDYSDTDAETARQLVKKRCAKCHGNDGLGVSDDYASLAGQPAEYLLKQLFNFKTGQRRNTKMQAVADKLTAPEAYIVAEYFSRLRPGFTPSTDEPAKAAGRKLYFEGNSETGVHNCASCHGVYATGGGTVARLAGQNPVYLETQIRKLVDQSRGNDRSMHAINAPLSHSEIRSLVVYLASEE